VNWLSGLALRAFWGGRVDSLETQASMIWECWQHLADLGGYFTAPWYRVSLTPEQCVPITSQDVLLAELERVAADPDMVLTLVQIQGDERDPQFLDVWLSVNLGLPHIGVGGATNNAILFIEQGRRTEGGQAFPCAWLLDCGVDLVRDFVNVWHPDFVSLDCLELIPEQPLPLVVGPVIGFVSRLAPWVVRAEKLPRVPFREEYQGGMLIGIAPNSKDPLEEARRLARRVYRSHALQPLPTVQPAPGEPFDALNRQSWTLMDWHDHLSLRAFWGDRRDSREVRARMVWDCWQRLAARGGFLAAPWYCLKWNDSTPASSFEVLLAEMTTVQVQDRPPYYLRQVQTTLEDGHAVRVQLGVDLLLSEAHRNEIILKMDSGFYADDWERLPTQWLLRGLFVTRIFLTSRSGRVRVWPRGR